MQPKYALGWKRRKPESLSLTNVPLKVKQRKPFKGREIAGTLAFGM